MIQLNQKILQQTNEVFKRLNILRRWTVFVTENKYNELAKQALNCITSFFIASYCEEVGGIEIHWEMFPKIAIYRAFQKAYVYFDIPEKTWQEIYKVGQNQKEDFNSATDAIIEELVDGNFKDFIKPETNALEYQIYRAGTRIATYIEITENEFKIKDSDEYKDNFKEIRKSLEQFYYIPGVKECVDENGKIFKVLCKLSSLRNQNRWAVWAYTMECSVLGHLFDTAVFAYYAGLEKWSGDESLATKVFFIGLLHDWVEVWTKDIPSYIKDKISGFRECIELYEVHILNDNLYSQLPEFLSKKIKSNMMEEAENRLFKKFMKGADYLSADSECWRQYVSGTRDKYFFNAMKNLDQKLNDGVFELPPESKKFHQSLINCVEKVCKI